MTSSNKSSSLTGEFAAQSADLFAELVVVVLRLGSVSLRVGRQLRERTLTLRQFHQQTLLLAHNLQPTGRVKSCLEKSENL